MNTVKRWSIAFSLIFGQLLGTWIPNFAFGASSNLTTRNFTLLYAFAKATSEKAGKIYGADSEGQVPDIVEFQALKDLYDELGGESWNVKSNWPTTGNWPSSAMNTTFGTWHGVLIENGDIVSINLPANNLVGDVPSSVGDLLQLRQLIINTNHITSLPAEIGNLINLVTLNAYQNNITSLPLEIGDLSSLQNIYLEHNEIAGGFPMGLTNLVALKQLLISHNPLSGILPASIGNLSSLEYLDLTNTQLIGILPTEIGNLANLVSLTLFDNNFNGPLPSEIGNLNELTYLGISGNDFTGAIPSSFGNLTSLQAFNAYSNEFTSLPNEIGNLLSIQYIFLDNNQLSGTFPAGLTNLIALKELRLDNNLLSGSIPPAIANLTSLTALSLNSNQFDGQLPSEIANLTNLEYLKVISNDFSGSLPDELGSLSNLRYLGLADNNFSGAIPNAFANLDNLETLYAFSNNFSSVPYEFCSLPSLRTIDLLNNSLTMFPNLSAAPNKGALTVQISLNPLGFGSLEPNFSESGQALTSSFSFNPIKIYSGLTTVDAYKNGQLVIPAHDPGQYSNVIWEKFVNGVWTNINTDNEDVTQATFKKSNVTANFAGKYKWRMTNSRFPNMVIESSEIEVSIIDRLDEFAFRYKYDGRHRMTHKKVPGADWVYMVYDDRDRLIFTQDGKQRTENKWSFIKYDQLNRPIITGIYTHNEPLTRDEMSALVSNSIFFETRDNNFPDGYTNTVFSASNFVIENFETLTVTYYDDYSFKPLLDNPTFDYQPNDYPEQYKDLNGKSFETVKGQVIATKTKVLNEGWWIWSVNYFDDKYQLIQNIATNAKEQVDRTTSIFDFAGKLIKTKTIHNLGVLNERIVDKEYEYDHAGRLIKTWYSMEGQAPVLLSMNSYNELGQLVTKRLHNEDPHTSSDAQRIFRQDVDYRYNIRGWLTSINDLSASGPSDLLKMNLYYNLPQPNGGPAQFNGNISQINWSGPDAEAKSYRFFYDPMNRLTNAFFFNNTIPSQNGRFNEEIQRSDGSSGYDLNGNIEYLRRQGHIGQDGFGNIAFGEMDNLTYSYHGNQLLGVSDAAHAETGFIDASNAGDDYAYDENGNMVVDQNKDITGVGTTSGVSKIIYNHLNLPEKVVKSNGQYLQYTYDATGRKLKQEVFTADGSSAKTTDYVGEFVYSGDTLKFVTHSEGRVVTNGGSTEFQYFLKDHLGNVRVTFTATPETEIAVATLEPENQNDEYSKFVRYDDSRRVQSYLFDRTHGSSPTSVEGYAQRLSGAANEKFGLARSLSVMPGDTITAEVYAKYVDPVSDNRSASLNALVAQIAQQIAAGATSTGLVVDGQTFSTSTAAFPFSEEASQNTAGSTGAGPKAYLNWLVFDRDYNLILGKCGYMRLSDTPKESGQDIDHERLFSPKISIDVAGYVYVYLSNENETPIEVYFDDFKVEHAKSSVVQMNDYYPFGLTFNSYQRENSLDQKYLYNGKELENELDLAWLDYGWRQYDATIGRFNSIDAFADKYFSMSPFQYGANNPIKYVDVNGDSLMLFKNGAYVATVDNGKEEITGYNQLSTTDKDGNETFTGGYNFGFNDIETDQATLKSGEMTVELISNSDMESALETSGVNDSENQDNKYSYIHRESRLQHDGSKGKMDFWATSDIMKGDNVLHVARSKAGDAVGYNGSDFGNFMWGMAGQRLGFNLTTLRLGAHYNNTMNGREDNKWNKKYEHKLLDSSADQRAIRNGYYFNRRFQENAVVLPKD